MVVACSCFLKALPLLLVLCAAAAGDVCPGAFDLAGHGRVELVPTGWGAAASPVEVVENRELVPHMGSRAYFADRCTAGVYDNTQYVALKLLGKTLRYTTDMAGAGCGCNAAFYLVSMRQNADPSSCHDFYCDANSVCGVPCSEIDIQEANLHAWHSTLHSSQDHGGLGVGYGGGDHWNGPRDFGPEQYGPGAACVDTNAPFDVAVSFPEDSEGRLAAMEVVLSQQGKNCPLTLRIEGYGGVQELSQALAAGMTPVVSYWSDNTMLWMDGQGADGRGPCAVDDAAACAGSVRFYGFEVFDIGSAPVPAAASPVPALAPQGGATCPGKFNVSGLGQVSLVPTGWHTDGALVEIAGGAVLVPHMGSRAYFASICTAGVYDHGQYLAMNLLGNTLTYMVDLSGAGCGCNAALYLVSMQQNDQRSSCNDYYCDANQVCGVSCAEIDIQEANMFAWHSTLHTPQDHAGVGAGFGGGGAWNGPRDFSGAQYGPDGSCIDTRRPFRVSASFPTNEAGVLQALRVVLSQEGHDCTLTAAVEQYGGLRELSEALSAGMTPVMSYWSSNDMLWMDGRGADGLGPCAVDDAGACTESVRFYDFAVLPSAAAAKVVDSDGAAVVIDDSPGVLDGAVASRQQPADLESRRIDPQEASGIANGDTVILSISVHSSDLPRNWSDRSTVILDFGDQRAAGRLVSPDGAGLTTSPERLPLTSGAAPLAMISAVGLLLLLLAAVLWKVAPWAQAWWLGTSRLWQGSGRRARPESLRFGELVQQSPLRRRSTVTPAVDDSSHSTGHARWPSAREVTMILSGDSVDDSRHQAL